MSAWPDGRRVGRAGRWGAALMALNAVLLFFPPIPPVLNGSSMPSYLLGLAALALLAVEVARHAGAIIAWWRGAPPSRRAAVAAVPPLLFGLSVLFRAALPDTFYRYQREEGLYEPLTVLCYLAGAILVWRSSAAAPAAERKPWRLLAALYVGLTLEEVDYFSVFGGMIGRIRGEYAGSLHDVIRLTALGIMGARAWLIAGALAAVVALVLWRTGHLAPRWIQARLRDPRIGWLVAGLAVVGIALAGEAQIGGWTFARPSLEEPIELAGATYLALYALAQAAGPAFYRPV